jgi:hypothetical protein
LIFSFVIPENVSQTISDVCGTNYECTYDYYVTGDVNLGRLSANFSDQFDDSNRPYNINANVIYLIFVLLYRLKYNVKDKRVSVWASE